ncbi:MAG TPA: polysaccharide deacetylase family protein [Kofleriaceae bacterium]|nr:polysaccharide deacetylase family protein [Kofleriaceae bacterium]
MKTAVMDRIPGVFRRGSATAKRVALTFDDGPDEMTPRYLEMLDELGVPATFFVCGARAAAHPDLIREYLRRGHQVANHGFDHTRFTKLGRKALIEQVAMTESAIRGQVTGRSWVRPPHGALDAGSLLALRASGYVVALWSVDSMDHAEKDPATIAETCSPAHVSAGDVVLFHEGQRWTLDALPRIVAALHDSGLECVTMHDLFAR